MIKVILKLPVDYQKEVSDYLAPYFLIGEDESTDEILVTDIKYVLNNQVQVTPRTFVISNLSDAENVLLIHKYKIHHLIGRNPQVYLDEILDNLRKLTSKQFWGFKHYFGDTLQERIISFSDSTNIQEKMTEELRNFQFDGYFSSPNDYLRLMANELLSNSLYKGPNKRRHEKGLEASDRRSPVFL
ncbi:MAG: hypothetical protein WDA09_04165, partial [Bacteriovoracaceae bacterium]